MDEAKPITTITTAKAVEFIKEIINGYGVMNNIITDNGKQFMGREFVDGGAELWHANSGHRWPPIGASAVLLRSGATEVASAYGRCSLASTLAWGGRGVAPIGGGGDNARDVRVRGGSCGGKKEDGERMTCESHLMGVNRSQQ